MENSNVFDQINKSVGLVPIPLYEVNPSSNVIIN